MKWNCWWKVTKYIKIPFKLGKLVKWLKIKRIKFKKWRYNSIKKVYTFEYCSEMCTVSPTKCRHHKAKVLNGHMVLSYMHLPIVQLWPRLEARWSSTDLGSVLTRAFIKAESGNFSRSPELPTPELTASSVRSAIQSSPTLYINCMSICMYYKGIIYLQPM